MRTIMQFATQKTTKSNNSSEQLMGKKGKTLCKYVGRSNEKIHISRVTKNDTCIHVHVHIYVYSRT